MWQSYIWNRNGVNSRFIYLYFKKKQLTFKFCPLQSPKSENSPVTMSNFSDQLGKDFFFFLLKGNRGP